MQTLLKATFLMMAATGILAAVSLFQPGDPEAQAAGEAAGPVIIGPPTCVPELCPTSTPTNTSITPTSTSGVIILPGTNTPVPPTPTNTPFGIVLPGTNTPTPMGGGPTDTPTPGALPLNTPTNTPTPTLGLAPTDTPAPTNTPPVIVPPPTAPGSLVGDVDCNGMVNAIDAAYILQLVAGLIDDLPCPQKADVNQDGDTNAIDATLILQYTAGLIGSLPV